MSEQVATVSNQATVEKDVTVTVNTHAVTFHDHKATGLLIKKTAISQKVPIQLDFALFEIKGHGQLKQIGDNEPVELHKGQAFRAVTPDDNS
jgi:hypothetical protein